MSTSSWRYVAARNSDAAGNISWNVRELYELRLDGKPTYTADGLAPEGESLQELRHDLRLMFSDVLREDTPILDLTGGEARLVPQAGYHAEQASDPGQRGPRSAPAATASLRRLRATDAPAVLHAFDSDPEMRRQGSVGSLVEAEHYVAGLLEPGSNFYPWAIVIDDELVGLVCVNVDAANRSGWFWYWMARASRGRGLTSRAAVGVANWALSALELERLELGHRVNNPASGSVARAAGFIQEGVERGKFLIEQRRIDVATYGRLATDPWPALAGLAMSEEP